MNTLKGIFPEPRPIPKRNFIKENMMHIKRMQGLIEDKEARIISNKRNKTQFMMSTSPIKATKAMRFIQDTKREIENLTRLANPHKVNINSNIPDKNILQKRRPNTSEPVDYRKYPPNITKQPSNDNRLKETAVQTEEFSDIRELYSRGTIKFPSSHVISVLTEKKAQKNKTNKDQKYTKPTEYGDHIKRRSDQEEFRRSFDSVNTKKDYIKENIEVLKYSTLKPETVNNPCMPPASYQKGIVPKYIRDRKELLKQSQDAVIGEECPDGHVTLPNDERKETLKMLRQSYSDLITELNMMPVRSDTLKLRNRKIHIENQLKKLDEGIKIFSRPKVYVKIDS